MSTFGVGRVPLKVVDSNVNAVDVSFWIQVYNANFHFCWLFDLANTKMHC